MQVVKPLLYKGMIAFYGQPSILKYYAFKTSVCSKSSILAFLLAVHKDIDSVPFYGANSAK